MVKRLKKGEQHPNAKLTDHEVALVRQLREVDKLSYGEIARRMETPKTTIIDLCRYATR